MFIGVVILLIFQNRLHVVGLDASASICQQKPQAYIQLADWQYKRDSFMRSNQLLPPVDYGINVKMEFIRFEGFGILGRIPPRGNLKLQYVILKPN